jgi:hypothetical protein
MISIFLYNPLKIINHNVSQFNPSSLVSWSTAPYIILIIYTDIPSIFYHNNNYYKPTKFKEKVVINLVKKYNSFRPG